MSYYADIFSIYVLIQCHGILAKQTIIIPFTVCARNSMSVN